MPLPIKGTIVNRGVFCVDCEYVEDPDDLGTKCYSCGCSLDKHVKVNVIVSD